MFGNRNTVWWSDEARHNEELYLQSEATAESLENFLLAAERHNAQHTLVRPCLLSHSGSLLVCHDKYIKQY
jgi:hypothetical protein